MTVKRERELQRENDGLRAELARVHARTNKARGIVAVAEALQRENETLRTQQGDYWEKAHNQAVKSKRETARWRDFFKAQRDTAVEACELAYRWLEWFNGGGDEPEVPVRDVLALLEKAKGNQA
ncbi:MAG: hypothetical protein M0R37_07795 [Bacteroidales bacterium]|nr:hypothetical protein [Bacteroidales bacterium]